MVRETPILLNGENGKISRYAPNTAYNQFVKYYIIIWFCVEKESGPTAGRSAARAAIGIHGLVPTAKIATISWSAGRRGSGCNAWLARRASVKDKLSFATYLS
jgi:hypothetical protein